MKRKEALVIGLGKSGKAATQLLIRQGYSVSGYDDREDISHVEFIKTLAPSQFKVLQKGKPLECVYDLVVVSPGVARSHLLYLQAKNMQLNIIGEIELACRYLKNKMIGITGTKGKTTLTALLAHIFKTEGQDALALGNIGDTLCEYALKAEDSRPILAIELSSFQLETFTSKCLDAAILTNISPDHLDRYSSFDEYVSMKLGISHCLKRKAPFILSKSIEDHFLTSIYHRPLILTDKLLHEKDNKEYLGFLKGDEYLRYIESFSKQGPSVDAILLSLEIAKIFNIERKAFKQALETFRRLPHRLEFVETIRGVHFYNDSKATNVESVIYAIHTLQEKVVLIAGGASKGFSFEKWREALPPKVKKVIALGETAPLIYSTLKDVMDVEIVSSLSDAIKLAFNVAIEHENVLLSPGCSSFDMFNDYVHRGECFKQIVLQMREEISV